MFIIEHAEEGMLFILRGTLGEKACPFGFDDIFIVVGLILKKRKSIHSFIAASHYFIYFYYNKLKKLPHKLINSIINITIIIYFYFVISFIY
jgi:hypothetical protein